jgi:hypothetical protein
MDRAHRIGQVRPVVVYRLVTEGASVERALVRRAAGKSSLSRMVLQEGKGRLLAGVTGGSSGSGGSGGGAVSPTTAEAAVIAAAAEEAHAVDGDDDDIVGNEVVLHRRSAAASAAAGGGSSSSAAAGDAAAAPRMGVTTEKLLSFWLREDVSDRALVNGGIGGECARCWLSLWAAGAG